MWSCFIAVRKKKEEGQREDAADSRALAGRGPRFQEPGSWPVLSEAGRVDGGFDGGSHTVGFLLNQRDPSLHWRPMPVNAQGPVTVEIELFEADAPKTVANL